MRIFGYIPARLAASRFPGKPLKKIKHITMLEHVYERAKLYKKWNSLSVTTCDKEIINFCNKKKYHSVLTSKKHERCLDRVFEAVNKHYKKIKSGDIIVCVQGDEPMLRPEMIKSVVNTLKKNKKAGASLLAINIISEKEFKNPDTVKVVNDLNGQVLYTSRSPIPFYKKFNKKNSPKRIGGIFAFRYHFLKKYSFLNPSPLEITESCDTNRLCDNGGGMFVSPVKYTNYYSVDSPKDLLKVRKEIIKTHLWKKYKI